MVARNRDNWTAANSPVLPQIAAAKSQGQMPRRMAPASWGGIGGKALVPILTPGLLGERELALEYVLAQSKQALPNSRLIWRQTASL
jgi:hypothetical protein